MSAITLSQPYVHRRRSSSPFGVIFCLFMIAMVAIIFSAHAVSRHGSDAHSIRRCLDQNGPVQIWRSGSVFYQICELEDGRFGFQAVRKTSKKFDVYHEITSFVKGKGTWEELMAYMQRLKAVQWNGPLP